MKKLNRTEIGVLAQKIYKNLDIPKREDIAKELKEKVRQLYLKQVKDFDDSIDGRVLAKYNIKIKAEKALNEIDGSRIEPPFTSINLLVTPLKSSCIYVFNVSLTNINVKKYPTLKEIQNEIILSQIEIKNLDELINKVTKVFK